VSFDLFLLILAGLASAWGFRSALKDAPKHWAAWLGALMFLSIGIQTAMLITVRGTGEILPGQQINPTTQAYWALLIQQGELMTPRAEYCLAALLALVLAVVPRPTRVVLYRTLPAAIVFVAFFFGLRNEQQMMFVPGHTNGASAFVTQVRNGDETELLFSVGGTDDLFLPILHRHTIDGPAPDASLTWSRDGEVVVFSTRSAHPYFALDREGNATGWLPDRKEQWPNTRPMPSDSIDLRRKVSTAQVDVSKVLDQHGGLRRD
jgi:hypothetical protein